MVACFTPKMGGGNPFLIEGVNGAIKYIEEGDKIRPVYIPNKSTKWNSKRVKATAQNTSGCTGITIQQIDKAKFAVEVEENNQKTLVLYPFAKSFGIKNTRTLSLNATLKLLRKGVPFKKLSLTSA